MVEYLPLNYHQLINPDAAYSSYLAMMTSSNCEEEEHCLQTLHLFLFELDKIVKMHLLLISKKTYNLLRTIDTSIRGDVYDMRAHCNCDSFR